MLIDRRITRVVLDTGTPIEVTHASVRPAGDTVSLTALDETGALYIGFYERFKSRYFAVNTANTATETLVVKYWDGSAWTAVDDLIDQTLNSAQTISLSRSGFITFDGAEDWQKTTQTPIDTDKELYWLQITTTGALADAVLDGVFNIFVDDNTLRQYYPELISNSAYLPPGRTDFLEQYIAASNLVSTQLEKIGAIDSIAEIIEPNEVALAAVHAAKYVILNGIPDKSEELQAQVIEAKESMIWEINQTKISVDSDLSGEIDEAVERDIGSIYIPRR